VMWGMIAAAQPYKTRADAPLTTPAGALASP
jgi:hypothetical protein